MTQPTINQAQPLPPPPAFGPLPPIGSGGTTVSVTPKKKGKRSKKTILWCTILLTFCALLGVVFNVVPEPIQAEIRQTKWWLTDHKPVFKTGPYIP
jgi:hypothetical protein